MAIAATIITVLLRTAGIAFILVPTQFGCTALLQGMQHRQLIIIGSTLHTKGSPVTFYHGSHFKTMASHYLAALQASGYSVSKGLCALISGHWAMCR
jgi:hypothetical protein